MIWARIGIKAIHSSGLASIYNWCCGVMLLMVIKAFKTLKKPGPGCFFFFSLVFIVMLLLNMNLFFLGMPFRAYSPVVAANDGNVSDEYPSWLHPRIAELARVEQPTWKDYLLLSYASLYNMNDHMFHDAPVNPSEPEDIPALIGFDYTFYIISILNSLNIMDWFFTPEEKMNFASAFKKNYYKFILATDLEYCLLPLEDNFEALKIFRMLGVSPEELNINWTKSAFNLFFGHDLLLENYTTRDGDTYRYLIGDGVGSTKFVGPDIEYMGLILFSFLHDENISLELNNSIFQATLDWFDEDEFHLHKWVDGGPWSTVGSLFAERVFNLLKKKDDPIVENQLSLVQQEILENLQPENGTFYQARDVQVDVLTDTYYGILLSKRLNLFNETWHHEKFKMKEHQDLVRQLVEKYICSGLNEATPYPGVRIFLPSFVNIIDTLVNMTVEIGVEDVLSKPLNETMKKFYYETAETLMGLHDAELNFIFNYGQLTILSAELFVFVGLTIMFYIILRKNRK